MPRRQARRLFALACTAALPLAGCGPTQDDLERELAEARGRTLRLLDANDVAARPAGTPERTIFELWRALQFRDAQRVFELVTGPPQSLRVRQAETIVSLADAARNARPEVREIRRAGDRARALLEIERVEQVGTTGTKRTRGTTGIALRRRGGRWLVVVDRALIAKAREAASDDG